MMDQDFLGEENHCRQVFFILIVQWSIEEDNTKGGKVAKDKGKTYGKNGKPEMHWEARQRINTQLSKLQFRAIVNALYHSEYLHK